MMRRSNSCLHFVAMALLASCVSAPPSGTTDRASASGPSTEWRRMTCQSCTGKHVVVESRRSIGSSGGPGSYTLVRVTNENAYAVVVGLSLYETDLTLDGEGVPHALTPVNVILRAAGGVGADHELVVSSRMPRMAVLHGADRY
ncbi:MAG: hypothetical protein V4617_12605 [Gemmatimonadota bacterium]